MKYEYDSNREVFKRVDGNGRYLKFNIEEARRIKSLRDMGTPVSSIHRKINWSNDISETQLRTFIENIEKGNIPLDGDYPIPVRKNPRTDKITELENKIDELDSRMTDMENRFSEIRSDCFVSAFAAPKKDSEKKSNISKVKSWLKF